MLANANPRDALQSPAVGLLCRLESEGCDIWIDNDRLFVRPISRLDPAFRDELRAHKTDLIGLVRLCDDGVQHRREAFRLALEGGVRADTLILCAGLPYVAGVCFSCGDRLERHVHGKCWRCALAWRLALRLPIDPALALVYDEQQRIA